MDKVKSTKQLARELGLLRKRNTSISTSGDNKRLKTNAQLFTHLIVMDYESTCWENEKTIPQEIIEFPAVLLNCQTGAIESEFHYYIQPTENPHLSDFCRQLTGISQDQVNDGIPLSLCLRKFLTWLKKLEREKGILCADDKKLSGIHNGNQQNRDNVAAFVTWSDWDLGVCLFYEAKRKQILKPSVLDRWIDLRATYRKFYSRRPDGLSGALKDLGINFDGRQHSGLDDAKNTAKLAYRMICDGCYLNITKTLKTGYSTSVDRVSLPPPTVKIGSSANHTPKVPDRNISKSINNTMTVFYVEDSSDAYKRMAACVGSKNSKLALRNTNLPISTAGTKKSEKYCTPEKSKNNEASEIKAQTHVKQIFLPNSRSGTSDKNCITQRPKKKELLLTNDQACTKQMQAFIKSPLSSKKSCIIKKTELHNISGYQKNLSLNTSSTSDQSTSSNVSMFIGNQSCISRLSDTANMPFKTPSPGDPKLLVRVTPPLCSCGRRSKRRFVQNPGPNVGRCFYSCPINNSSCHGKSRGCKFFKWETPPLRNKMPR